MIVLGPVLSFSFFLLSAFLIGTLGFWAMFIGWQFIFIAIGLFIVLNIFLFASISRSTHGYLIGFLKRIIINI